MNWNIINDTAKTIGISPAATVQHWIDEATAMQRELDQLRDTWREHAATVPQDIKESARKYFVRQDENPDFDFDAIRANELNAVYEYACDQAEMWQDRGRIEKRYRLAWNALMAADLLEVGDGDISGVGISQDAYDIAAGKLTDPFSTAPREIFADYDLNEEDLAPRGL